MNFSDSFHFAGLADCADYNHFTDFVKVKIDLFGNPTQSANKFHTLTRLCRKIFLFCYPTVKITLPILPILYFAVAGKGLL